MIRLQRIFQSALLVAVTTACSATGAQDMRARTNNRSALISGAAHGETSGTPIQRAQTQPIVLARYAPFNGLWTATIHVLQPATVGASTATAQLVAPGDGAKWTGTSGGLPYFSGVDPWSSFRDNAADVTLWGSAAPGGRSFYGLTLGELFTVVGQAMKAANTSSGFIVALSTQADDTTVSLSTKRRSAVAFGGSRSAVVRGETAAAGGQFSARTFVAVPELVATSASFTSQFPIIGCNVANDPVAKCVARAGVAFLPFTGTLAPATAALAVTTRATSSAGSLYGAEQVEVLERYGLAGLRLGERATRGVGVAGAAQVSVVPTIQLDSVATSNIESLTFSELTAATRFAAASPFSIAAAFLTSPPNSTAGLTAVTLAYGRRLLSDPCPTCNASLPLGSGTTIATGRVRDDAGTLSLGVPGRSTVDGTAPQRRIVR